jgi:PAS domain S-box-containing protein
METSPTKQQLLLENEELRTRLEEAEETLRAIRSGEVDALVVSGTQGDQVYTLQGADRSYRILMETMEEGAATLGKDGTILYCNRRLAAMLGSPLEKVIGSPMAKYLSPVDWQALQRRFKKGKSGTNRGEINLKIADGNRLPVLVSSASLETGDGQEVCLTVADLTEQKRRAVELRKARDELKIRVQERTKELVQANSTLRNEIEERKRGEEALRRSEENARQQAVQLRALMDATPAMIWIAHDPACSRISGNHVAQEFSRVSGGTDMSKTGPSPEKLAHFRIFKDGVELAPQDMPLQRVAATGDELKEYGLEFLFNDGRVVSLTGNVKPLFDGQGRPAGAIGAFLDITEHKQMEEELRRSRGELEIRVRERTAELARANKELREEMARREKAEEQLRQAQKMESIGTLTGGIAHDFNNILQTIAINGDLALLDLPPDSVIRNYLELILKSGMRGKDLVKQLLLFSRKSAKMQEILSLTPVIKESFKLLRSSIPTTIEMKLLLETGSDTVCADPSQVQQVIMNLVTNAAYAMRGAKGSIDISLEDLTFDPNDLPESDMQPGDYLVLSVKDTGCGMGREVRDRIFEPFFTTKPVGEGAGLGLSVVYGIVKNHKGNITVYSEPGKGTIFRVYLPKVDTEISIEAETLKPIPGGNERILFVDDEEFIINSGRNMLQHLGYQVTALMDSQEALKVFSEDPFQFDLVITDQTMPFMTGEDLGKVFMNIRPDIPVILCTGYSDMISSEKATAMGFQGFIMKPFTVREGAELVRSVLDQKNCSAK